jgi:Ni,Fe-hydrogenase maturation factor
MTKKVLYFGNPHIQEDSLAIKVCEELEKYLKFQEIRFEKIENTFQLIEHDLKDVTIVDVVKGLKKVQEIKVSNLKQDNISSLHDFDLGFFLKLLAQNKNIKIIGIPLNYNFDKAVQEVRELVL